MGLKTDGEAYAITDGKIPMLWYSKEEFRKYIKEASDEYVDEYDIFDEE